jgi:hypothetical protein
MANYCGFARSNYVRFDPIKLEALQVLFDIEIFTDQKTGFIAIGSNSEDGTPNCELDDDPDLIAAYTKLVGDPPTEPDLYVHFLNVVHHAFAEDPGGLFVWQEVGFEKLRYLTGFAFAIDATGEIVKMTGIDDIYETPDVNTGARY